MNGQGFSPFFEADSEKKMRHLLLSKNVTELLRNCIVKWNRCDILWESKYLRAKVNLADLEKSDGWKNIWNRFLRA